MLQKKNKLINEELTFFMEKFLNIKILMERQMFKLYFPLLALTSILYTGSASAVDCQECISKTSADCVNFFALGADECHKFAEENCQDIGSCSRK